MQEIYILSIYVTIHQENEIKKLFKSHGWEYDRVDEVEKNKEEAHPVTDDETDHKAPKNHTLCDKELPVHGVSLQRKNEPTAQNPTSEATEKFQVHKINIKVDNATMKPLGCDNGDNKASGDVVLEMPENLVIQKSDIKKHKNPRQEYTQSVKKKMVLPMRVNRRGKTNKQSQNSNQNSSFQVNINTKNKERIVALQGKKDIVNDSSERKIKNPLSQAVPSETNTCQSEKEANEKVLREPYKPVETVVTNDKMYVEESEINQLKSTESKGKKPKISIKKGKSKTLTSLSELDNQIKEMEKSLPEDVKLKVLQVFKDAESSKNGIKGFQCFYCSRVFRKRSNFIKHIDKHTKQAFDCPECGKRFNNHRNMNAHRFNRSRLKEFKCDICGHKAKTACLLRIHDKTEHPPSETFYCHLCPKVVNTKAYLNMHLKFSHGIDEGIYECPICGQKSKRPKHFQKHLKEHQNDNNHKDRQCSICHKVFKSKLLLRSHKRVHLDRKHECKLCGKRFSTATKLAGHERTHSGVKPYQCPHCDYKSTQAGNLRSHMKVHQREQEVKKESAKSKSKSAQKKLTTNETCASVLDQTNPNQVWYDNKNYAHDQMLPVSTTTQYEGQGVVYPEQGQQIFDSELVYNNLKTSSAKDDCHQQLPDEMYATPQVANQYSLDYNMENFTNAYDTSQYYNPVDSSYMIQNDTTITNSVTTHPQQMHHLYQQQSGHMSDHQSHHQQQVHEQHQPHQVQQGHSQTTVSHGVMYQTSIAAETAKHECIEQQNSLYPSQYYTNISKHSNTGNYHQGMKFDKYEHDQNLMYPSDKSDFTTSSSRIYLGDVTGQEPLNYPYTATTTLQYSERASQQDYDIHPRNTYTELQQATVTNANQSQMS